MFPFTYQIPRVILAQFSVACAFAVRTMRVSFDQLNTRTEQFGLTLGCRRSQAFWMVVVPEARRGLITAATLAWAVRTGVLTPAQLQALATPMSAISPEGRQVVADALTRTERGGGGHTKTVHTRTERSSSSDGHTKTVHTRTVTWHSTGASGASGSPRAGKVIAVVAVVALALYFLFAR